MICSLQAYISLKTIKLIDCHPLIRVVIKLNDPHTHTQMYTSRCKCAHIDQRELWCRQTVKTVQLNRSKFWIQNPDLPEFYSYLRHDSLFTCFSSLQRCPCRLPSATSYRLTNTSSAEEVQPPHSYLPQSVPIHHLIYLITPPKQSCHSLVTFQQNKGVQ